MAVVPISTSAIASAESALRGISKIPGGYRAQVRIVAALEMIKGLNTACTQNMTPQDAKVLRWLEYHVRYLTELLEPFVMMHRYQISPLLQSEVLMLSRELETASSKLKPTVASTETPKSYSFYTRGREEHDGNTPDVRAFTLDLKFALDQFRRRSMSVC
ncbi:hypothetical protein BS47DRAFT_1350676 [Hydnum rufescens UP504]|uniref:Uncharacterized protein n=1 Tax=Hydnum rufescens UP504 TaxID=1448309 RepID=A0A9P6ALT8_9AGAM|nr:hypothetical protein BS47DRAFT_1350676 [Hydnum rufescens UP504]